MSINTKADTCAAVTLSSTTKEAIDGTNVASQNSGGIPFASGSYGCNESNEGEGNNFGSGIHCFNNINDGKLGNSYSWIPGASSVGGKKFVGVRFAGDKTITGLRVSRKGEGSCCNDRTGGTYKVETTRVGSASYNTPDTAWCTAGSFTRSTTGFLYYKLSVPIDASAIRLIVSDSTACIDELEVYQATTLTYVCTDEWVCVLVPPKQLVPKFRISGFQNFTNLKIPQFLNS